MIVVVRPVQISLQHNAQVSTSVFRCYEIASNLVIIIKDRTDRTVKFHYDTLRIIEVKSPFYTPI